MSRRFQGRRGSARHGTGFRAARGGDRRSGAHAVGRRGGSLAGWHPVDLLGFTLAELVRRAGIDPALVDEVIAGCVTQAGEQSWNVGRNAGA
jgi:acetyl-CoA acetyltransferase